MKVMDQPFIHGLQLSEFYYQEAVKPILAEHFPLLVYSAARLGSGSEVLGYDTPQSRDHAWGPKLQLFVSESDHARHSDDLVRLLSATLPHEVRGYPTHFDEPDLNEASLAAIDSGPIRHGVTVHTRQAFFDAYLGFDPAGAIGVADWLACPGQLLRTITSGRVFHDGLGELKPIQAKLLYYPRDLWFYLLAAQWRRISQEEPFMARCGDVGDEVGSRLIAARLVREVMQLCFLMERQYAPYAKWFGTAFAELKSAPALSPIFQSVLDGSTWKEREAHLSRAYEIAATMHNALGVTPPLTTQVSQFHSRPYLVMQADRFVSALQEAITDEAVRRLPLHLGAVEQFSDSTDVLSYASRLRRLRALYEPE
jgi:hypothetical protein